MNSELKDFWKHVGIGAVVVCGSGVLIGVAAGAATAAITSAATVAGGALIGGIVGGAIATLVELNLFAEYFKKNYEDIVKWLNQNPEASDSTKQFYCVLSDVSGRIINCKNFVLNNKKKNPTQSSVSTVPIEDVKDSTDSEFDVRQFQNKTVEAKIVAVNENHTQTTIATIHIPIEQAIASGLILHQQILLGSKQEILKLALGKSN